MTALVHGHEEYRHVNPDPKLALSEAYCLYNEQIRDYIKVLSEGSNDGKDIVQNAFLKLSGKIRKFDSYENMKRFLIVAARNEFLNIVKHEKVANKYIQHLRRAGEADYDTGYISSEVIMMLKKGIDNLSQGQKDVIDRFTQGKSNKEIAEDLGLRKNTVAKQKSLAIEALRKIFENWNFAVLVRYFFLRLQKNFAL